ncbi:hypothetical protein C8R44DRAFT_989078 [Mycena epipterygia]|nr:hypothetical protein C8R44DRAFT_989078 [Mycena epipterygia]
MSDPASGPVLHLSPLTVIGPIFMGNTFNWMLTGILVIQVYDYWRNFPQDTTTTKSLVYSVFVLNLTQTAFGAHETWWFVVQNWGNLPSLQEGPWTSVLSPILCGLISAIVQIFYAFRIATFGNNIITRLLATVIVLLALAQSLAAIVASSLLQMNLTQQNLIRLHPLFSFWLVGSFVTDIIIAASMTWMLHTARFHIHNSRINNAVNRIIMATIQTGALTVICAGVSLALFAKYTEENYYFAFTYILGKLYSNSFMATLNSRVHRKPAEHSGNIDESAIEFEDMQFAKTTIEEMQFASQKSRQLTTDLSTDDVSAGQSVEIDLSDRSMHSSSNDDAIAE